MKISMKTDKTDFRYFKAILLEIYCCIQVWKINHFLQQFFGFWNIPSFVLQTQLSYCEGATNIGLAGQSHLSLM